jgi:signal transduction histidine kinase
MLVRTPNPDEHVAPPAGPPRENPALAPAAEAEARVNILVVDDCPQNLTAFEAILSDLKQNLTAASGTEALQLLLKQDFAVILLDVNLPGINGFETATLIRQRKRSETTPIIFVSAISTTEWHTCKGYAVGAVDYMFTPIIPEILRAKVAVFVDLVRKTEQVKVQAEQLRLIEEQEHQRELVEAEKIRQLNAALKARAHQLEATNQELQKEITVRQQTEEALKETNAELESFCYSVSHDLRAPLRAMQGFSEALLEDFGRTLGDVGRDYAARIVTASSRMDELIQDLLLYSRISHNALQLEPVNWDRIISQALAQLEAPIRDARAEIIIEKPFFTVVGHPATLVQVVGNLISNGTKFVSRGTSPKVRLRMEQRDVWGRFWVEDNGIGIAPKFHSRIFRVFERLHGLETYPGTGIGLAIVRKGTERMGGRVGLESAPNDGSRFWIELPLFPDPLRDRVWLDPVREPFFDTITVGGTTRSRAARPTRMFRMTTPAPTVIFPPSRTDLQPTKPRPRGHAPRSALP